MSKRQRIMGDRVMCLHMSHNMTDVDFHRTNKSVGLAAGSIFINVIPKQVLPENKSQYSPKVLLSILFVSVI